METCPFKTSENTLRFCLCLLKTSSCCRGAFHPFRVTTGNVKNSRKTGKFLLDEKKIAKPLFYRYSVSAFLSSTISNGQVSEWSNEHAWKVCVPQTGTEGSNPSLSAINFSPQCIRHEYIAVFVCLGMGKKWGKSSLLSPSHDRIFLRHIIVKFSFTLYNYFVQ